MAVGVGSVGDVIALVLLVRDCTNALSDARGSSSAYQAVVRELWLLEKALLEIDILCQTYNDSPELNGVRDAAKEVVDGCKKSLEAFKAKLRKYGPYLGSKAGGSGAGAKQLVAGPAMKLLYAVSQKDETARFRAEVVAYSVSLNQILATATLHVLKTGQERIEEQLRAAGTSTNTDIKELQLQLKDVNSRIGQTGGILAARLDWLSKLGADIKSMMQKLMASNLAMLTAIGDLQKSVALLTSSATQSLNSEPKILFEDALGRVYPITLQWISCWDMFDSVLQLHFKDMQGAEKVARKEYVLTNRATGGDLDLSKQLDRVFLPGQFVQMYMLFQKTFEVDPGVPEDDGDTCPNCEAPSNQPKGLEVKCSVCGLIYKRMTEEGLKDEGEAVQRPTVPDAPDSGHTVPQKSLEVMAGHQSDPAAQPAPPETATPTVDKEDMSNFKRVRLIARKMRRRIPPAPQEEEDLWASFLTTKKKSKKKGGNQLLKIETDENGELKLTNETTEDASDPWGTSSRAHKGKGKNASRAAEPEVPRKTTSSPRPTYPYGDPSVYYSRPLYSSDGPRDRAAPDTRHPRAQYNYTPPNDYRTPYYAQYSGRGALTGYDYTYQTSPVRRTGHTRRTASPTRPQRRYFTVKGSEQDTDDGYVYEYHPPPPTPRRRPPSARRQSVSASASRATGAPKPAGPPPKREATPEDAARAGIPAGYDMKNWDPEEEPILLLGSVFDANTLGKWIYDWTVYVHGATTPLADMAGDLWLLLIKVAGSMKRAEHALPGIRSREDREMVEDFIDSGERLMGHRLRRLLKVCEGNMIQEVKSAGKDDWVVVGKNRGKVFIETIFGRDKELDTCEKWMTAARLWSMRFSANVTDLLRNPAA